MLIHRTFACGAAWTGDESGLTKALRTAFPKCRIVRFEWTGANSHSARLAAADELRKLLRLIQAELPDSRVHLVGHSHGGNVALYALRDFNVAKSVSSLVCISTPFILCAGRNTGRLVVQLGTVLSALLVTGVELICIDIGTRVGAVGEVMLAGNYAVFVGMWFAARRFGPRIHSWAFEKSQRIVQRLDLGDRPTLVLAARVARDEAALLLRSSYLALRVPHLVNTMALAALVIVGATVAIVLFGFGPLAGQGPLPVYTTWFEAALLALASYLLVIVSTALLRSHPLAFGREGLFDGFFVDMNIGVAPPFKVVRRRFGVPRRFRLRHSALYADPLFLEYLPFWVNIVEEAHAQLEAGASSTRKPVKPYGRARSFFIANLHASNLRAAPVTNVDRSSHLMTDDARAYWSVGREFASQGTTLHAAREFARPGGIHSNTAENFFSILKRGVVGTYHHWSPAHMHRYLAEFDRRYSTKDVTDGECAATILKGMEGRRLTYRRISRLAA